MLGIMLMLVILLLLVFFLFFVIIFVCIWKSYFFFCRKLGLLFKRCLQGEGFNFVVIGWDFLKVNLQYFDLVELLLFIFGDVFLVFIGFFIVLVLEEGVLQQQSFLDLIRELQLEFGEQNQVVYGINGIYVIGGFMIIIGNIYIYNGLVLGGLLGFGDFLVNFDFLYFIFEEGDFGFFGFFIFYQEDGKVWYLVEIEYCGVMFFNRGLRS